MVVVLLTIDPLLTLLAVGTLPVVNVVAKRFGTAPPPRDDGHPGRVGRAGRGRRGDGVGRPGREGLRRRGRASGGGFGVEADDVYDASMRATMVRATLLAGPRAAARPSGSIATLGYGGHRVLDGDLSIGTLVAFNVYVVMLIWPLRMLGMILAQAQRAAAVGRAGARGARRRAGGRRPGPPGAAAAATAARGRRRPVRRRPLRATRAPRRPCSTASTSTIAPGESVALVGATGSGKSTVARLLPRFYDVDGGAHRRSTASTCATSRLHDLRRAVGIVFEETFLFADTVAANIAFADPDAAAGARSSGRPGWPAPTSSSPTCPTATRTVVGERGFSLSGGQRQRIAIARAILADPRVLVLDDATSAVDPTKEHEIRDALAEVMRGRTTIVIAHRPATIALADRVVLLDGGRVAADGTHAELLADAASATARCWPRRPPRGPATTASPRRSGLMWSMAGVDEEDRLDRAEAVHVAAPRRPDAAARTGGSCGGAIALIVVCTVDGARRPVPRALRHRPRHHARATPAP